jgi:hypothetical protein
MCVRSEKSGSLFFMGQSVQEVLLFRHREFSYRLKSNMQL